MKKSNEKRYILQKTGDTVFYLRSLKVENEDKLYLKASHINAMRREALALLFEERSKLLDKSKETPENAEDESFLPCKAERIKLRLSYENVDAISVFASEKADEIIVNAKDIKAALSKVDKSKLIGKLPEIEYDDLKMRGLIREMRSLGVDKVLCENIGAVYMAREEGMCIFGGSGLNVINSLSLNAYADMGVVEMTLSTECDRGILLNIKGRIKTGIVAYGYLPVMYMNACPNISSGCARCSGINKISGRKGEDLFTYCHSRKYVTLHNGVKLYVLDKLSDIPNLSHAVLAFTKENESECDGVIRSFLKREIPEGDFTRGIYFKTLI